MKKEVLSTGLEVQNDTGWPFVCITGVFCKCLPLLQIVLQG